MHKPTFMCDVDVDKRSQRTVMNLNNLIRTINISIKLPNPNY